MQAIFGMPMQATFRIMGFVSGHRFTDAVVLVLKGRGFSRAVSAQNQWRLQPLPAL
jgi:hypothetical protein